MTVTVTLHFHSNAAKRMFVREGAWSASEFVAEGPAFVTLVESSTSVPLNFENNPHVYSVDRVETLEN